MNQPLKVVMIIQSYYPRIGGAERQTMRLAPLLEERQVQVEVITRRYPGMEPFELVNGLPVHRLPAPQPKPVGALSFTLAALPLVARLKPDILHAHELLSPASTGVAAKRLFGLPLVAKVLLSGSTGDLAKLRNSPLGKWRFQGMRQQVDRFIFISREIESELRQAGVPSEKMAYIPNGVDHHHFAPLPLEQKAAVRASLGLPAEAPIALFAGRMVAQKRLDLLISCWPAVRALHPQAELILLGSGDQQAWLQAQAGPGIRFLPPVTDILPYLQAADLFVLPSATEGLSNALLEALSTALPVVATRVGGAPDVIADRKSGWLVTPGDAAEIQAAILTLLQDPALRACLGQAGRERVRLEYSLTATADRYRQLYEDLAGARIPANQLHLGRRP